MIILTGNSNLKFAEIIARKLHTKLGSCIVTKFSNNETRIKEISDSLRGEDVYIIFSSGENVNDQFFEVMLMSHTAHYSSAKSVVLVMPYYIYARQDRKMKSRDAQSARMIVDLLSIVHCDHIITVDLHNAAIQGFFKNSIDNLTAIPIFAAYIRDHIMEIGKGEGMAKDSYVIISPDAGGVPRARDLANKLGLSTGIIYKERKEVNAIEDMKLLIEDGLDGKIAIIVDDMADTCGTLNRAAKLLKENGAIAVYAMVTHPILSGNAIENINSSVIDTLYVTDSVNLYDKEVECKKLQVLTITTLIAGAISRHSKNESMAPLFEYDEKDVVIMLDKENMQTLGDIIVRAESIDVS